MNYVVLLCFCLISNFCFAQADFFHVEVSILDPLYSTFTSISSSDEKEKDIILSTLKKTPDSLLARNYQLMSDAFVINNNTSYRYEQAQQSKTLLAHLALIEDPSEDLFNRVEQFVSGAVTFKVYTEIDETGKTYFSHKYSGIHVKFNDKLCFKINPKLEIDSRYGGDVYDNFINSECLTPQYKALLEELKEAKRLEVLREKIDRTSGSLGLGVSDDDRFNSEDKTSPQGVQSPTSRDYKVIIDT